MRVFRTAGYRATAWKNGLGTTREILRHPEGATEFLYRLSLAEVSQSCDFSAFPGYDRIITLLDGDGFELHLANGRSHALTMAHAPYVFDGGAPVACTVAGGPSRDLNLMIRRDAATAECVVLDVAGHVVLPPAPGATRLLVSLTADVTLRCGGQSPTLGRWDAVRIDATAHRDEVICDGAAPARLFHAIVRLGPDSA